MAGLGEKGQAACPVTAANPLILSPGLCLISFQTSPNIQLPHAQELCLPSHDVPQSSETFTNTRVTLYPRKHPQNATERDSMGSTSCCRENCLRAEIGWQ